MGFRFQRRIRILPGLRINLSKTGVSTSVGGKGFTVNLRNDATKTTVGLPGTGLSYSQTGKPRGLWLVLLVGAALLFAWLLL